MSGWSSNKNCFPDLVSYDGHDKCVKLEILLVKESGMFGIRCFSYFVREEKTCAQLYVSPWLGSPMSQLVKLAAVPLSSQYLTSATWWVGALWKGRMETMHFMMTLKRDVAKVKITRIHLSLDPSSQSTTTAQTRAPPDINDALNVNMTAIRIILFH